MDYDDQKVHNLTQILSKQYWSQEIPLIHRLKEKYLNHYIHKLGIQQQIKRQPDQDSCMTPLFSKMSEAEEQRSLVYLSNSNRKEIESYSQTSQIRQRPLTSSIKSKGSRNQRIQTSYDAGKVRFSDQVNKSSFEEGNQSLEERAKTLSNYDCIVQNVPPTPTINRRQISLSAQNHNRFKEKIKNNMYQGDSVQWTDEHIQNYKQYQKDLLTLKQQQVKGINQTRPILRAKKFNKINIEWQNECESFEDQEIFDQVMRRIENSKQKPDQYQMDDYVSKLKLAQNKLIRRKSNRAQGIISNETRSKVFGFNRNQNILQSRDNEYSNKSGSRCQSLHESSIDSSLYLSLYSWDSKKTSKPPSRLNTSVDLNTTKYSEERNNSFSDLTNTKQSEDDMSTKSKSIQSAILNRGRNIVKIGQYIQTIQLKKEF